MLYCCIVLLRQQEPTRSFSAMGCPRLGTRLGMSESRGTGTSVDCCTRSPGYGWYGGAFVYNVRPHKHTSASTDFIHGANQHPHIHIPAIFRIVMGKLHLHLSSIPGVEIGIQTLYATSTISCKVSKMPVATLGAIFYGTCKKRALIIKRSITLLPYVSISVILTTKC